MQAFLKFICDLTQSVCRIHSSPDDIRLDFWKEEKAFCNFCKIDLTSTTGARGKHRSHLLYECQKVPNSSPINKKINNRKRPEAVFKRLAEIAAAYDPGGQ